MRIFDIRIGNKKLENLSTDEVAEGCEASIVPIPLMKSLNVHNKGYHFIASDWTELSSDGMRNCAVVDQKKMKFSPTIAPHLARSMTMSVT